MAFVTSENISAGILRTLKPFQTTLVVVVPVLRLLKRSWKFADVAALCAMAALLVVNSGFAVRCRVEQRQMNRLIQRAQQRQQACLALGLQWEANDQERQYRPGTSAGTNATVGPISGFVMDVTENEFGHAEGRCHAINASYKELIAEY